jgi:hypothetical protein
MVIRRLQARKRPVNIYAGQSTRGYSKTRYAFTASARQCLQMRRSLPPRTARPGSDARGGCLGAHAAAVASTIRKLKSILQIVDRQPAPALLPILRSQQQGEILALLGNPDLELSLTEIAARVGAPFHDTITSRPLLRLAVPHD